MINIIECNNRYSDLSYFVQTIIDGRVTEEHEIRCKSTTITKEDKVHFLLFDRYSNLNKSVFEYVNIYMDNLQKSKQAKEKMMVSLKYLYSFMSIFNIEIREMTSNEASLFKLFLQGYSVSGADVSLCFNTIRYRTSVNSYLSSIRNYIKYLGYKNHPLLETGSRTKSVLNEYTGEVNMISSFMYSSYVSQRTNVPKHITLDEFMKILNYVHKSKNKQLECIVRLMYESGLRIGEVLGLTYEDLQVLENENTEIIHKVILRNRKTDKTWQSSKNLMKIKSLQDYASRDYQLRGFGYENVFISKSLFELILDTIEETHLKHQKLKFESWHNYCVTDSVENKFKENNNFYIFTNSLGKPLSNKTLNSLIKNVFVQCGVKVNLDGGKFDGLCHRFRHGFAMYQINYNKTPLIILKELMRHKSISSTLIYYTPDTSTIVMIKNDLTQKLYELIPEFDLTKEIDK